MSNELFSVKRFFESHHIPLSNIWLDNCISWCKEENLNPNYTLQELQSKIYEQWLLLDLRDVEVPSLPPNLASKKHFVLNGNFSLQIMKVVDISKPKLWQLQKIRNTNALTRVTQQDSDLVGTGKRMLLITLTDGVQEVDAMEYHPIPGLNINLPPGIKIKLFGPVTIRRGRIMLDDKNIKLLGGEVEELLVSNAAENVLAMKLNLPLNPNPYKVDENLLTVRSEETVDGLTLSSLTETRSIQRTNLSSNTKKVSKPCSISEEEMKMSEEIDLLLEAEKSVNCTNVKKTSRVLSEEEFKLSQEIEFLLEAERSVNGPPARRDNKTPDLFEDSEFDPADFDDISRIPTSTQAVTRSKTTVDHDLSKSFEDSDDDVFSTINIDAHLDKIDKQVEPVSPHSNKEKIITISKLLENRSSINEGIFKVKAKFNSVVQKLTIDDEYKIVIKIEDDTGILTVRVHNDILSDFAGYCPAAILSLKNHILDKNEAAMEKVMTALGRLKERLLQIDNVMAIEVNKDEENPMILRML